MNALDIIITALHSLGGSKLRSGLTLLGIIIGITAVTVLMSIGRGVQENITSRIQSQGTNLLFVRPSSDGGASTLTLQDAEALIDPIFAPSVKAVAPQINSNAQIVAGRENTSAQIIGVTSGYASVRNVNVDKGQFINPAHVQNNLDAAVISASVAETLFGTRDPLDERIRINGRQFTVVGVLEDTGATFFGFGSQVFVPISTAHHRLSRQRTTQGEISVNSIDVQAVSQEAIDDAQLEIASILRLRHHITDENDFEIDTLQDLIETVNQVTTVLVLFLGHGRGNIAARWRNRRYEHHARVRNRAHARNRYPQSDGSKAPRHPVPIRDRGRLPDNSGGAHRHRPIPRPFAADQSDSQ